MICIFSLCLAPCCCLSRRLPCILPAATLNYSHQLEPRSAGFLPEAFPATHSSSLQVPTDSWAACPLHMCSPQRGQRSRGGHMQPSTLPRGGGAYVGLWPP